MMESHKHDSDLAENWTRDAESLRQTWNQCCHWCDTQKTSTPTWQLALQPENQGTCSYGAKGQQLYTGFDLAYELTQCWRNQLLLTEKIEESSKASAVTAMHACMQPCHKQARIMEAW